MQVLLIAQDELGNRTKIAMEKKHIGSSFDDFLEEEGILEECKEEATKRVLVWQLEQEMKKQNLTKEEVAKRMHTSRAAVNRVLDPSKPSTLRSLTSAARAKRLRLSII